MQTATVRQQLTANSTTSKDARSEMKRTTIETVSTYDEGARETG